MTYRNHLLLSAPLMLVLGACDQFPMAGDNTGPKITVHVIEPGGPRLVMSTDADEAEGVELTECPGGGTGTQVANTSISLPAGQSRGDILIGFSDTSGIGSASFSVDASSVRIFEPVLSVTDLPRHGGGTFRGYAWRYDDDDGVAPFTSPVLRSVDLAPTRTLTGAPFALSATDGAGNTTTRVFFVGPSGTFCG